MSAPAVWEPDPIVVRGTTFDEKFTWLKADGVTPVDLTGATALSTWRQNLDDAVALTTLTDALVANVGQVKLGGVAGTVEIIVDAKVTRTWPVGTLHFDVLIYTGAGGDPTIEPFLLGKVKVLTSASALGA